MIFLGVLTFVSIVILISNARHALQQQMSAGEQCNQGSFDNNVLAHHNAGNPFANRTNELTDTLIHSILSQLFHGQVPMMEISVQATAQSPAGCRRAIRISRTSPYELKKVAPYERRSSRPKATFSSAPTIPKWNCAC